MKYTNADAEGVHLLKTASQNSGPYLAVNAVNIVLGHDRKARIDMSAVAQLAVPTHIIL